MNSCLKTAAIVNCVILAGITSALMLATASESQAANVSASQPAPHQSSSAMAGVSLPLAALKLPYQPRFVPAAGHGYVFQSYDYKDWRYQVQYRYDSHSERWNFDGYSATRLRLVDGTPLEHNNAHSKEVHLHPLKFCPPPIDPSLRGSTTNSSVSEGEHPEDNCPPQSPVPDPPPPGTIPQPTFHGTPHQVVSNKKVGRWWTVKVKDTWMTTSSHPEGKWYRTYRNVTRTGG